MERPTAGTGRGGDVVSEVHALHEPTTWHAAILLLRPQRIAQHLRQLFAAGVVDRAPTLWQLELGVLRMWHRVVFRADTVGTCADHPVRSTWRAGLLHYRLLRGPFLVWESAIAPFDHSGLAQPTWRMIRHLLAAHHDRRQFSYDLEILRGTPGALDEVIERARAVLRDDTPRARWLRDLVVFEGYHEALLEAALAVRDGRPLLLPTEQDDPDIGFDAYVRWCLAQPATPRETLAAWRAGRFPRPMTRAAGAEDDA